MHHTPASAALYRRTAAAYRRLHRTGWAYSGTRANVQGSWVPLYAHPNAPAVLLAVLPTGRVVAAL